MYLLMGTFDYMDNVQSNFTMGLCICYMQVAQPLSYPPITLV